MWETWNRSLGWKIPWRRKWQPAPVFLPEKSYGQRSLVAYSPWGFSMQEYWSGLPGPPPVDLPNPGIEPRYPILQVDSLPFEPPGKPKNIRVGSLSLLQGIFLTQESTGVSSIAGRFFTSWATREAQLIYFRINYFRAKTINFIYARKQPCLDGSFNLVSSSFSSTRWKIRLSCWN